MTKVTKIRVCDRITGECYVPQEEEMVKITRGLREELLDRGIACDVGRRTGSSIDITGCRLSQEYIDEYGYNLSPYAEMFGGKLRRGRILGWEDWVEVNDAINDVLDEQDVSANVQSLGGKFKIRRGRDRMRRDDWEDLAYENVGSMMHPISREDAWMSEGRGREGWRRDKQKKKARHRRR